MLLAIALLPAFVGEAHFNAQSYSLNFARTPERRELDYVRQTGASVETAKEVKIFGLNRFLIERYRTLAASFFEANRRIALRRAGWGSVLSAIGTVAYYVAYAYIVWRTLHGEFSIGDLTFLAGSFRRLRNLLEGLLMGFSQVAGQALYLDDLFSFFEIQPEIVPPPNPRPFPVPIRAGLRLRERRLSLSRRRALGGARARPSRFAPAKSWRWSARTAPARRRSSSCSRASTIRTRAASCSTATTCANTISSRCARTSASSSRTSCAITSPPRTTSPSGRIEARDDRPRIVAAAKRSLADEVIRKLPGGYDQVLGKRFRTGVDLSGGEWQKIAIARAYMRDAQLLILDEPTAALDARAEFEVFKRFKEMSRGKTVVLISHRFSSVRMADRIVVLADGAIEAIGTHAAAAASRAAATRSSSSCRPRVTGKA